jgi:mycothiol system anti-sigma-R factor
MSEPLLNCEQVLRRVLEFVDCELTEIARRQLEGHLDTCRSCYSRVEFERRLKARLADLSHDPAPVAVRNRIARLIDGF